MHKEQTYGKRLGPEINHLKGDVKDTVEDKVPEKSPNSSNYASKSAKCFFQHDATPQIDIQVCRNDVDRPRLSGGQYRTKMIVTL